MKDLRVGLKVDLGGREVCAARALEDDVRAGGFVEIWGEVGCTRFGLGRLRGGRGRGGGSSSFVGSGGRHGEGEGRREDEGREGRLSLIFVELKSQTSEKKASIGYQFVRR